MPEIRESSKERTLSQQVEIAIRGLKWLLDRIRDIPEEWIGNDNETRGGSSNGGMECTPCDSYRDLVTAWRKALRWTDGLDHALAVMLAAVASTKMLGDQLWVKIIGPAACGKSTLSEALTINRKYVRAQSTFRGFYSGYRSAESGGDSQDNSLIPLIRGKTFIIKDGDALLQAPNLSQILSEGRDLYDTVSRPHYRNRMGKNYEGIRTTVILCGTSSLRAIDQSELGERFLDCVIMEGINDELEDEILWRVVNRADRNLSVESNGKPETQYEPDLVKAMQLTGGYVEWLRENAVDLLPTIDYPEPMRRLVTRLGKFVAYMRARPSARQSEGGEREFATRLVSQLARLGKCLALVLNRDSVDAVVMARVRRVALDTARGRTLAILHHMLDAEDGGVEPRRLGMLMGFPEEKTRDLLRFLRQIGAIEHYEDQVKGIGGRIRWRLTPKMHRLYLDAMGDA